MRQVRFMGVGSFVPSRVISNDRIAAAIPGWSPERIEEKLGIHERRFLWDFDTERGKAIPPPDLEFYPANNVEMCEVALRGALKMAQVDGDALDALFVVTCTPDRLNFNHDAMALHEKVGCRPDAFGLVLDDGCGGTPYVIDLARKMIEGLGKQDPPIDPRTVDVWIGRLRRAFRASGAGNPLRTVHAMGYVLDAP